jgi:SAM-dependent methyltransferase
MENEPKHNLDPTIDNLEMMADAVNYQNWIYSQFEKYAGNRIVEMGAGIGNYTKLFLNKELVVAVDNCSSCIEYMKNRFSGNKNIILLKMDISKPDVNELTVYKPDTIICLNVLEHIEKDEEALSYMYNTLVRNGKLLLLVPAFRCLFGGVDLLVGHQRRYQKKELKNKLLRAGFKITDLYFMNSVGMFGWFLNNRILKRKSQPSSQVMFFDKYVVPWLSSLERLIRLPFGLSLIAIAEK